MKTEELFVDYQTSLKLKEIGFDEPCLRVGNPNEYIMWKWFEVDDDTESVGVDDIINTHFDERFIDIPTIDQVKNWFLKKYSIWVEVFIDDNETFGYLISRFNKIGRLDSPMKREFGSSKETYNRAFNYIIDNNLINK